MFALIDCNNFYASCERLFRPDLRSQPIVVLSSNDGCVIARSNEAKDLGIAMGVPYFKMQKHHIHVFSSNFALYGDLSRRVMAVIAQEWPFMKQYSIDEAFLDLRQMPPHLHDMFCKNLQKLILKSTGIPTSIGIGPTKTLAKIANHICKKELKTPVFQISQKSAWLARISIGDVWGIGRQWQKKLAIRHIKTAADLAALSPLALKRQFPLPLVHTGLELQGIVTQALSDVESRKSIVSSRSFGQMQTDLVPLIQSVSRHARAVCQKLRLQQSCVKQLSVFIVTNRFRQDLPQYYHHMTHIFIAPTDDLRLITTAAIDCLKQIYKPGVHYKKAGVCVDVLMSKHHRQMDMLDQPTTEEADKINCLMTMFDRINHKFGKDTLKLAAEGFQHTYAARSSMCSPLYTTQWSDLPTVVNKT
ncbi:MAG: DNA polymerase V, subunit C [Legionella sp.]|nr:MAG: DNA polymerase V, subunit C [Legionella sp.]